MIHFIGTSHAALHLKAAAIAKGLEVTDKLERASLVFISEDTPTSEFGERDMKPIRELIRGAFSVVGPDVAVVVTSQCPPGFCRSLRLPVYHLVETLRIKDAPERALKPEYHAIGCPDPRERLPHELFRYCRAFPAQIIKLSWEEAEVSKICVNLFLASQVAATNRLSAMCEKVGADWKRVSNVLHHDKRIGPYAYLVPGDPFQSRHLLRDKVTYDELMVAVDRSHV